MKKEEKIAYKVSIISIVANVILSVLKLIAGVVAKSNAMISDAVHSLSDVFSTVVVMIGIKIASKDSDKEHPYGHERLECVAAIVLATMLLGTGLVIGWKSLNSIMTYSDIAVPGILALIAAIVSILVKEAMYRYTLHYAEIIKSSAMKADAWHHRSDALSSIGALIGVYGARHGFLWMDGAAGLVIFVFIVKTAYDIFMEAVNKMVDHACDEETENKIRTCVLEDPDVLGIDLLQTRVFGNKIYVDLEILLNGYYSLDKGHEIAERVHGKIESEFSEVKHIMIHVNPKKD